MAAKPSAALLAELRARLPGVPMIDGSHPAADRLPYEQDWRKRYQGQALAIVFPRSTEQVQQIVRWCSEHQISLIPQGGNTSLVGGSIPDGSATQLVVNLRRMNRILGVDAENLSLSVEAGCTLQQVQDAALDAGLLFPLSLASEGSCTIGGNLATNAGGTQVLRFGTARDLCLGIQAVTADGSVLDELRALRKDNTGYATKDLLIGSEGTLGVITAATLRLFPRPRSQQAALVTCPDIQSAVGLLGLARQHLDASLTGFEIIHRDAYQIALRHTPTQARAATDLMSSVGNPAPDWLVLLDAGSPQSAESLQTNLEDLISRAIHLGLAVNATLSTNQHQYHAMWQLRETIPMAEKIEGQMVKHDIAVPTSAVPTFVQTCQTRLSAAFPGCRIVCFGHLGDGNLHYNVQAPQGTRDQDFLSQHEQSVNQIVYDLVQELQGTLSAEHGIGQLKKDELAARANPVRLQWMHSIKRSLDPQGLLNPGRVIASE